MVNDDEVAVIRAIIAPIMSGIKTGGDGMRVQLDIPESEMGEAVKLIAWRQRVLIVTIRPEQDHDRTISRTKAKRRNTEGGTGVQ
jgi:hypothetical protein